MNQTKIGELLHRDHLATLQALQRLENYVINQTSRRVPDVKDAKVSKLLTEVVGMLSSEVGRHFGFEEQHLFPRLADAGETGISQFLAFEHASILPLANQISAATAEALENGFTEASWKEFHGVATELCEREMFHIQKEEMGLLAAISMLIDPATDAALAATFESLLAAAAAE